MKKILLALMASTVLFSVNAQIRIDVTVSSNVFTPANITINQGDTVRWTNVGGFHNVNGTTATYPANPASFGNAVGTGWTYSFVFDTPGFYNYQCDPHVGLGMIGTVAVLAVDNTNDDWVTTGAVTSTNSSVGIGTGSVATGYLLSVDGKIIAEEMQVLDSGIWPDYVFNKDYDLMALEELEQFIKANHHLPGIPSAQIVKEEGIGVGEMNKLLLEKIEELTLHMIKQSKQLMKQNKKITEQSEQIKMLREENSEIKSKILRID